MKTSLLSLLLALSLLAGCAVGGVSQVTPGPADGQVTAPALAEEQAAGAQSAYAGFAAALLRQCRREGEDTLLSPLSVALALGMTANGAAGDTAAGFKALFGMDAATLNSFCHQLLSDYRALGGSTEATLVNSLWCDPDLTLDETFSARCRQLYDAQLYQADLQAPATVKSVNDWVSQATRGLIPTVVEEFSPDAVLALVNAIYLKNQFALPFETPTSDWELDFTAEDGTVTHPKGMRNGTRNERYVAAQNGQGVVLPYDDGRLGLLLMLPDEGLTLTEYLASWSGGTVKALLDAAGERRVALTVPKFKTEWGGSLAGALAGMGLAQAFDPEKADFGALGTAANGYPLFIGDVIHKTAFELNEKGTEAAAVTAVVMECGSAMPPDDLIVLRFDRPFVYGIVDLETGAPLFLGTAERLG